MTRQKFFEEALAQWIFSPSSSPSSPFFPLTVRYANEDFFFIFC
jgi:hypothetical protein